MALSSSGASPSLRRNKRTRSERVGPASEDSAGRGVVKRARTSHPAMEPSPQWLGGDADGVGGGVESQVGGEARAGGTSVSRAAVVIAPGCVQSPSILPSGSLRADFLGHEPNVLFRDSASTIPDDDSTRQRLLDLALASQAAADGRVKGAFGTSKVVELEASRSSSFPWTASEQTASSRSAREANADLQGRLFGSAEAVEAIGAQGVEVNDVQGGEMVTAVQPDREQALLLPYNRYVSPTVEIKIPTFASQSSEDATQMTKRRSRKTNEAQTAPSDHESLAVSLPTERYVPRPTRRRATQIPDLPENYSVNPDKAAKAKRTKSSDASFPSTEPATKGRHAMERDDSKQETQDTAVKPAVCDPPSKEAQDDTINKSSESRKDMPEVMESQQPSAKGTNGSEPTNSNSQATPQVLSQDQCQKSCIESNIFVKPSLPARKSKQTSKTKRSHTTIFEDHVEYTQTRPSPSLSLSQRQAKRKAVALQDVKNESSPVVSQRRNKVVASDDEDEDEDELSLDTAPAFGVDSVRSVKNRTVSEASKKTEPETKTAEDNRTVSKDEASENPDASEPPKKKRGRGRPRIDSTATAPEPAKANTASQPPDADRSDAAARDELPPDDGTATNETKNDAAQPQSTPENQTATSASNDPDRATQDPTPSCSPQRQTTEQEAATKTAIKTAPAPAPKSSPTTHSPIRSSSAVPLRVGLSKRQRIPPLLKTMKPLKR